MNIIQDKDKKTFENLKTALELKNVMQAPRLLKVVISVGTGKMRDKNKGELITDRLTKITGQKPSPRPARLSIASFKLREGEIIGYQITLRGKRMYDFLERFVNVALPRTKDFRGLNAKAIDDMGNFTIGVKEHTIFPETSDEDVRDVFGLAITVVTSAKDKKSAKAFFDYLGFPFAKPGTDGKKK